MPDVRENGGMDGSEAENITVDVGTGAKVSTVSLRVGCKLDQKLESEAAARNTNKSEVIRDACRRLLKPSDRH